MSNMNIAYIHRLPKHLSTHANRLDLAYTQKHKQILRIQHFYRRIRTLTPQNDRNFDHKPLITAAKINI